MNERGVSDNEPPSSFVRGDLRRVDGVRDRDRCRLVAFEVVNVTNRAFSRDEIPRQVPWFSTIRQNWRCSSGTKSVLRLESLTSLTWRAETDLELVGHEIAAETIRDTSESSRRSRRSRLSANKYGARGKGKREQSNVCKAINTRGRLKNCDQSGMEWRG